MIPEFTVEREFGAGRLNAVVNHPGVRPWVGAGSHPLDLTSVVSDQDNVLLMGQGGGLLFIRYAPGIYEVHTQFIPEARGRAAIEATNDALRWMFTKTDAVEILTKVPDRNKGALGLVKAIHGELRFHRDNAWLAADGPDGVGHYALTIQSWAGKCAAVETSGHWFHEKLEAAKEHLGATNPLHDDDEAHDRYVGATVEMILAGQVAKAINFYNEWAPFAGYATVSIIAANPLVIDIQDAILAVRGGDFEVLLCR